MSENNTLGKGKIGLATIAGFIVPTLLVVGLLYLMVAFRDGLTETQSRMRIRAKEHEREYLRKLYRAKYRRQPAFNLLYDCSEFSQGQIAQQIVYALKLKGYVPKR